VGKHSHKRVSNTPTFCHLTAESVVVKACTPDFAKQNIPNLPCDILNDDCQIPQGNRAAQGLLHSISFGNEGK
jgi:hypothetical protein